MRFLSMKLHAMGVVLAVCALLGTAGTGHRRGTGAFRVVRRAGHRGELDFRDEAGGLEPGYALLSG